MVTATATAGGGVCCDGDNTKTMATATMTVILVTRQRRLYRPTMPMAVAGTVAGAAVLNYSTDSLLEARITLRVRVPRIHIGDNLAQIKAMRLANVQTFGSNVWRPNINLSAPQIDFSCGADRKMVIFYV